MQGNLLRIRPLEKVAYKIHSQGVLRVNTDKPEAQRDNRLAYDNMTSNQRGWQRGAGS